MRYLLFIAGLFWAAAGQAEGMLVIASTKVPKIQISSDELSSIYKLKKKFWDDNMLVVPVNRDASSKEREKFTEAVFNLSTQDMAEYWNRLRFQGKFPPVVQVSDQAVLAFVRRIPGAIGYIAAGHSDPIGVKVLKRIP